MTNVIIVQSSLNPHSKTRIVINNVITVLKQRDVDFELIDLKDFKQEWCDGRRLEDYSKTTQSIFKKIKDSKVVIIGFPVYQYSFSGVLKNFIDIHGKAFEHKPVAIVENSGGVRSYLAARDLMNSLTFEVSSIMLMPVVHTFSADFSGTKLVNEKISEKIDEMIDTVLKYV